MPLANYFPTGAEEYALEHIIHLFDGSKAYYSDKHSRMKRLYAKYMNVAVRQPRPPAHSDERLGMVYRCAEILHAIISQSIMKQSPFGKIFAEGDEDFAGKQIIDKIHSKQQRETRIYNTIDTATKYSVVCGHGHIMPGWDHHVERAFQQMPKTMQLANPGDPFGMPLEIPTGEYETVEILNNISRIDARIIQPWNVFPVAGATSMYGLHTLIYRVPMTRKELYTKEHSGDFKNVDMIDFEKATGPTIPDEYIDETDVYKAKKEGSAVQEDKETVWMLYAYTNFPYFKFKDHVNQEKLQRDDEYDCLIVMPQYDDVIVKMDVTGMDLQVKPGVPFKYGGFDDMFFGVSPLEIAEALIQLDEDMFNYTQDRAKREVYQKIAAVEGVDMSALSQGDLTGIVKIPKELLTKGINAGNAVNLVNMGPSQMPHLMQQRETIYGLIDDVTAVLDFVRGTSQDDDETATKTRQRTQFIGTRFGKRLDYFEHNGLWWWMQWQTVLNAIFLEDHVVQRIAGDPKRPLFLNPFKLIRPTIPMESYDFSFEASSKMIEDPVKAQILRGVLEFAGNIRPGLNSQGELVVLNPTTVLEEYFKKINVTDDLEKFFIKIDSPQDLAMFTGGGSSPQGGAVPLGATNEADLLSSMTKVPTDKAPR